MSNKETTEQSPDTGAEAADEEPAAESDRATPAVDEERTPVEVEHAPPRMSQVIAVVAALFGALLTAPFATLAIPFGIAGFTVVAAGLFYTHSRDWLTIGTALVLMGALIAGAYGAVSPELMLVGIGSAIIAWDIGQHGIVIGEQLGRKTRSQRAQIVHVSITAIVIGTISTIAYVGYLFAGGGRHVAAVAVVVLGIVLMAWALRD